MTEFKECASCRAKPGSPTLCESCLHNRTTINVLNDLVENQTYDLNLFANALEALYKRMDWTIMGLTGIIILYALISC